MQKCKETLTPVSLQESYTMWQISSVQPDPPQKEEKQNTIEYIFPGGCVNTEDLYNSFLSFNIVYIIWVYNHEVSFNKYTTHCVPLERRFKVLNNVY